ncbi:Hypothetical protein D9617_33g038360 [Elsinoe fawcettii]|nr:Hypothetical protein D9617_33g038360 [Elsinoe fawcettii]
MTRVLLIGATAHLSTTLLPLLLQSPYISSVILLSRASIRSAPILAHEKVTQILHPDFSSFPPELFRKLRDKYRINAAIWLVGGWISRFKTFDEALAANVSYPLQFLEGCLEEGVVPSPAGLQVANGEETGAQGSQGGESVGQAGGRKKRYVDPESQKSPFRFVYLSTYNAVQDQFASLWGDAKFRRLKGAGEKALLGLADEKGQGMCEVYCLRIGRVLDGGQTVGNVVKMRLGGYISDEVLNKKVVSLCLGGRGDEKYGDQTGGGVLENDEVMGEGWADFNSVTVAF